MKIQLNMTEVFTSESKDINFIKRTLPKFVFQIGLIGLVEHEWIDTLATLDPEDVTFEDFVERGRELARALKERVCAVQGRV
jgi:5'-nucleotidase